MSGRSPRESTLADVRRSYSADKAWQELSGELPVYLVFRPISFALTVPLLRAGVPAWAVTLTSLGVALALPAVAFFAPAARASAYVALLAILVHLLDCIDGNLARVRGEASAFGALLDGAVDGVFWTLFFVAIGVVVARAGGWLAPHALVVGLACAALVLLGRRIRDEHHARFGAPVLAERRPSRLGAGDLARVALGGLENAYALGLLVAGALGGGALDVALAVIAVYVAIVFVVSVALTLLQAARYRSSHGDG